MKTARSIQKLYSKIILTILENKFIGKSTFKFGLAYVKFPSGQIDNDILTDPSYFNISFYNTEYRRSTEGFEVVLNSIPYGS